jgi:4-aminobutyrate aminotransferase-like enzyme
MEFVKEDKKPAPELTKKIIIAAAEQGLMLGKLGLYGNVIRIAPPLTVTEDEIELGVSILEKAIDSVSG